MDAMKKNTVNGSGLYPLINANTMAKHENKKVFNDTVAFQHICGDVWW
jgi:hypothetical protein